MHIGEATNANFLVFSLTWTGLEPTIYHTQGEHVNHYIIGFLLSLMVFDASFNNISVILWRSVLLVEEFWEIGENHRPVASHWQTLSHNVVHFTLIEIRTHNISGDDCIGSCKSNYHTITATTAPLTSLVPFLRIPGILTASGIHIILVVGYGWSKVLLDVNSDVSSSRETIWTWKFDKYI